MISALQFNPAFPASVVITVASMLFLFFSWLEWKRQARFLFARLAALFVAMLSLTAFLLRPAYSTFSDSAGVIVLTAGYSESAADSVKKIYPHYRVVATPGTVGDAERLTQLNQLLTYREHIRFVLGVGLPTYVLPDSGFCFLAAQPPNGITDLQLPNPVIANRNTTVKGVWHGEPGFVKFKGPEGNLDSAVVKAGSFQLSFTPHQAGKFLYELEIDGKDEPLALEVESPRPLDILILQHYPSAEVRYLKSHLIDRGHRVVVRTQISKDNFRFEYGNRASARWPRITAEVLEGFDLLVLANEGVGKEVAVISEAVRRGLGVLWLPAENELAKPPFGFEFKKMNTDTAVVNFENQILTLPAWPIQAVNDIPVVENKSRTLAGFRRLGAGKVGYQLLTETYPLIAQGQAKFYHQVWATVLESLARISRQPTAMKVTNDFPVYPDEPLAIEVLAADPLIYLDSIRLALREHTVIDDYWHTTAWAHGKGWHQLRSATDSITTNFFVSDVDAWPSLRATSLQKATRAKADGTIALEAHKRGYKTIPPLLFFALFVLTIGFLWLAPKL